MRNPVPPLREDAATLNQRLQPAHDGHQTPRLPMRYRLATRQAQARQPVARLLGIHRHPLGRWLAREAAGGLEALLAPYVPPGHPVGLAPPGLASLEQALRRPDGGASSDALRPWMAPPPPGPVTYQTLDTLGRTRFQPRPQVPRPRHTQNSGGPCRVPGDLSSTPPAGHPPREHASCPGVQSGRPPRRPPHHPRAAPHGPGGTAWRPWPAPCRVGLRRWRRGAHHG